jgi:hypothetical protein
MRSTIVAAAACLGLVIPVLAQDYPDQNRGSYQNSGNRDRNYDRDQGYNYPGRIPAGTQIKVRTNDDINVRDRADGRIYTGTVADNVLGENGTLLIPKGANAELIAENVGNGEMSVDLESVTVRGHRYMVAAQAYDRARHVGLGKNRRTGEYVGGGALLGTVIGALAGGGKGAAIGALAGAGAGAGGEVLTRGRALRIPAETVLTFRLDQPLDIGRGRYTRDNGYDRNGYHYHGDYYHRAEPQQDNGQYQSPPR